MKMTPTPEEVIAKYYPPGTKAHTMFMRHAQQVAGKALAVAARVPALEPDPDFIRNGAFLHDIGILKTDAPQIHCHGDLPYLWHGVAGRRILEAEGLGHYGRVCECHVGVGLTAADIKKMGLPLPAVDMLPETIEEKIICYADKFFSKKNDATGDEKSVKKIVKKLSRISEEKAAIFLEWTRLFKEDVSG